MLSPVAHAVEEIKEAFTPSPVSVEDDGFGGAYVIVENVDLGARYVPRTSWLGGHVTAQTPYSDVYPLYVGADVTRADGSALQAPITAGHHFRDRQAIQISRRTNRLDPERQTPAVKFKKVLHYLRNEA